MKWFVVGVLIATMINLASSIKKFMLLKQNKIEVTKKELGTATFNEVLSQFTLLLTITVAFLDVWFE